MNNLKVFFGASVFLLSTITEAGLIGISSSTDSLYAIDSNSGAATLLTGISGNASLTGASFLNGELYATDIFGSNSRESDFQVIADILAGA